MTTLSTCGCSAPHPLMFLPPLVTGTAILIAAHFGGWPRRVALTVSVGFASLGLTAVGRTVYVGSAAPLGALLVNLAGLSFWSITLFVAWWRWRSPRLVSGMPGTRLAAIVELWCDPRDYALVSVISDMQEQYCNALTASRKWKARIVRARGYWRFAQTAGLQFPLSLVRLIVTLWKLGN
jgi:hypothetical protein